MTVYIKNQKRRGYIIVRKGTLPFKDVSKKIIKQTKINEKE